MSETSWKDRVIAERSELSDKLDKLKAYLGVPREAASEAAAQHHALLHRQADAMAAYLAILDERIALFDQL